VGTNWVAVEIDGQPIDLQPGQRAPMLSIEPGTDRFRGYAGCNGMSGAVTQGPDGIRFKNVISTKMACAALDIETRFLTALNEVTSYRIAGDTLELLDARMVRIRLKAAP
jgi:heat shock protein HslJ